MEIVSSIFGGGGGGGGLGGILGSLFGGGGGGGGGLSGITGFIDWLNKITGGKIEGSTSVPFVPQGLEGVADKNWQQMYGQMWDQMQKTNPQLAQQMQGAFTGAQQATPGIQQQYNQLSGMTPGLMQQLLSQGQQTGQGIGQLMGAGNQLWQQALDPQNAYRNQLQQQVTDASRAGSSARGLGMGPQGQGMENQAIGDFMRQWEAQKSGREAQALQGMSGAFGQAGNLGRDVGQDITGALQVGGMGPMFSQAGMQLPFDIANMFGGGMNQNIYQPLGAAMGVGQNYMNTGVPATANNFAANQTSLRNLTNSLYGLGQMFQQPQGGGSAGGGYGYQTDPYAMGGYGT